MNLKAMIVAAVAALSLGVGAVYAQGAPSGFQPPVYGPSDSGQATPAQSVPAGNKSGVPQSTPLFTISGVMGVYLWAPVEPAYDANSNRNLAANPLWESSGPTTQ